MVELIEVIAGSEGATTVGVVLAFVDTDRAGEVLETPEESVTT